MSDKHLYIEREERIPIEADTTVEFGEPIHSSHAKSVNMTSGGVLLHFDEPVELAVGDTVTCDFVVEHKQNQPLPYWGLGRIVRVDSADSVAVELQATGLVPLNPESAAASVPVLSRF
jgi:hypothetical protein